MKTSSSLSLSQVLPHLEADQVVYHTLLDIFRYYLHQKQKKEFFEIVSQHLIQPDVIVQLLRVEIDLFMQSLLAAKNDVILIRLWKENATFSHILTLRINFAEELYETQVECY